MASPDPAISLYPYQKRWIMDQSRFKEGMWARQTGKSFSSAAEIVIDCRERERTTWVSISSGERQVKELMEKVKLHGEITGLAMDFAEETYGYLLPSGERDEYKVLETVFRNGSRVIGVPANPDTARGYSANVYLDEFSVHKASREIWAAVFPIISRSGYRLVVTFTPKGKQNKAYELWNNELFSKHRVDIYQAVDEGCPHDIDMLRSAIDDPDLWAQEYELAFLDEATAFLTYDMINEVESDAAAMNCHLHELAGRDLYLGMDIGRKKDLSVIWLLEKSGDVFWTRGVEVLDKLPFRLQRQVLFNYLNLVRRACVDATGLGMQLAEEAQEAFGSYRVEAVTFTGPVKEDLAVSLRRKFEDREVRLPIDRTVREDLHSVKKYVTAAGNARYDAERTEDGHADRFWALALAIHAASSPSGPVEYESVTKRTFVQKGAY